MIPNLINVGHLSWLPSNQLWVPTEDESWLSRAVLYNPLIRLPEFVFGVVLGVYFLKAREKIIKHAMILLTMGVGGMIISLAVISPLIPMTLLSNGLLAPLIACLILGFATANSGLTRFFSTHAMRILGGSSYAIYILHWPLMIFASILDRHLLGEYSSREPLLYFLIYLTAVIAISVFVFKNVEEPLRKWLRFSTSPMSKSKMVNSSA